MLAGFKFINLELLIFQVCWLNKVSGLVINEFLVIFLYVAIIIGTAGSGKTALTHALSLYLEEKGEDFCILNLDPGVKDDSLPYTPDINVRDFVRVEDVMSYYDLGPNGAFIASMDLVLNHVEDLREQINDFSPDILLIDTPGQMEIFAYRPTGSILLNRLLDFPDIRKALVFIFDPFLCQVSPGTLLSTLLLAESVYWRFELPMVHVLSKIDLFESEIIDEIINLAKNPSKILVSEETFAIKHIEKSPLISTLLEKDEILRKELIPASSITGDGIFDIYSNLLNAWSETG